MEVIYGGVEPIYLNSFQVPGEAGKSAGRTVRLMYRVYLVQRKCIFDLSE